MLRSTVVGSVRARLSAGGEVATSALAPASVFSSSTPCCSRLVHITEAELVRGDRSVTVRCPGCSGIWQARVYAPAVHWDH